MKNYGFFGVLLVSNFLCADEKKVGGIYVQQGGYVTVNYHGSSSSVVSDMKNNVVTDQKTSQDVIQETIQQAIQKQQLDQETIQQAIQKQQVDQEAIQQVVQKQQTDFQTLQQQVADLQAQAQAAAKNMTFFEQFHDVKNHCMKAKDSLISWAYDNVLEITATGIVAAYSYCAYKIYQANKIIYDPAAWSNWQGDKTVEQLFALSQNELQSQLLFEFQIRFIHPTHPTDFIYALVQSSISLQHEIDTIALQIKRYQLIAKCRCLRLFLIDGGSLNVLEEKYKKLLFMKHIFASWCAKYKIDNHTDASILVAAKNDNDSCDS